MREIAKRENESGTDETAISASNDPVYQKGLELVARNNCLTCHKVDDVFTGPSYRQIAKDIKVHQLQKWQNLHKRSSKAEMECGVQP